MDTGVRQPVIQPHGMGAAGESLRKGISSLGTGIDMLFQRNGISNASLFELIG
ncbi:hypothetical protein D3C79_1121340 [compost metagenome]